MINQHPRVQKSEVLRVGWRVHPTWTKHWYEWVV